MGLSFGRDFFGLPFTLVRFDSTAAGSISSSRATEEKGALLAATLLPWESGSERHVVVAGRMVPTAAVCRRWARSAAPSICAILRRIPPARGLVGSGRHRLVASDARERSIVVFFMNERMGMNSAILRRSPPAFRSIVALSVVRRAELKQCTMHQAPANAHACTHHFFVHCTVPNSPRIIVKSPRKNLFFVAF